VLNEKKIVSNYIEVIEISDELCQIIVNSPLNNIPSTPLIQELENHKNAETNKYLIEYCHYLGFYWPQPFKTQG